MTVALQVLRYAANLGVTMALARLVAPLDFGVFAMAATFTGLLLLFKDGGMETALISHGAVTDPERAAVAGLTCFYGFILAGICAALGPVLARLYGEPHLTLALLLPAGAFIFYGLDVLPGVELLRTHRFRTHAAIELIATLAGWSVALALAARGAGYWALFATEPVSAATLLIGHSFAVRWRPRFSLGWEAARRFMDFGRTVSINRALGHIGRNVDNLILGLAAGAVPLAFYNKAFRLIGLPQESINGPLSRIATPLLAQLRGQPAEFVRAFRHFNLTSMALGLPGVAFLLISAPEIVAVIYGAQWTPVVPLLRLLGLMGLGHTFLFANGWVYTAMGTVRRQLRWELFNVTALAASFLVGVHWGAAGVAVAASIAYTVLRGPALVYCFRDTPLRLRDVGEILWRPLLASALAAGLVLLVRTLTPAPATALVTVLRDGSVLVAGYALGWILVPGWRTFLRHELRRPEPTTPANG